MEDNSEHHHGNKYCDGANGNRTAPSNEIPRFHDLLQRLSRLEFLLDQVLPLLLGDDVLIAGSTDVDEGGSDEAPCADDVGRFLLERELTLAVGAAEAFEAGSLGTGAEGMGHGFSTVGCLRTCSAVRAVASSRSSQSM